MRKVGKIGRINIDANEKLKYIFEQKDIRSCELRHPGCTCQYALTFAHRHKRIWYRSRPEMLSDFNQVLLLCQHCHAYIEYSPYLTHDAFMRLRGPENAAKDED